MKYNKDKKGRIILEPKGKLKRQIEMYKEEIHGGGLLSVVSIKDFLEDKGISHAVNRNIGRDLPSIIDGLNSVERRIKYTMDRMGLRHNRPRVKVVGIIGQAMKLVYPHGDLSPNNTIGRMGRKGSIMIPYIDKEGDFGNPYTKRAAASRYISARLSAYSDDCFFSENDAQNYIYDTRPNYDYSDVEPIYLPTKYPNALMQWSMGIGVGTSSQIAAFNPSEIMEAAIKLIDDHEAKINIYPDTMNEMTIINKSELRGCFDKFSFNIKMRTPYETIVEKDLVNGKPVDKYMLVFHGVPLNTKGSTIEENIRKLKQEEEKSAIKKFKEIKDVNYDASKDGTDAWIFIEYEKGYDPDVLAEKLYKSTQFETTINARYVYHKDNKPQEFTPRSVLLEWIDFRQEQLRRYIQQMIVNAAIDKLKYEGLIKIYDDNLIDDLIKVIKEFKGTDDDLEDKVSKKFGITPTQAKYIINIRLKTLSNLNMGDLQKNLKAAKKKYEHYRSILNEASIKELIKEQLTEGISKYGRPRLAKLIDLNEKKKNKDDDEVKVVYYNDQGYYCTQEPSRDLPTIAPLMTNTYRVVEFRNGDLVMLFSKNGQMRMVTGYAFTSSTTEISLAVNLMEDICSIIPVKSHKRIALVSGMGISKVIEVSDISKSVQCKVMNVGTNDYLADVVPIKGKGTLVMVADDKMYYFPIDKIPVMKRSSAGSNILKEVKTPIITSIAYIPNNHPYVVMYGDNGYMKVLSTQYLSYDKKATDYISMVGKGIAGVTSIGSNSNHSGEVLAYHGSEGEWALGIKVEDHTVYISESDQILAKFPISSTVGNSVKVFKKNKNQFYKIFI